MRDFRRRVALAMAVGSAAALVPVAAPVRADTADRTSPRTAVAAQVSTRDHRDDQVCGPPYIDDDRRLGPKYLPKTGPLGRILEGYERYGGLSPNRFLYRYWDETAQPMGWRYPPDDGFAHDGDVINGRPAKRRVTLRAGQYLDRFGSERGAFLARAGASFSGRALPPDSLNTNPADPEHVCNYHVYRVVKAFDVEAGPAAPAFQQPGKDVQYHLVGSYVPGAPKALSVGWLVDTGRYLRRVN
ncbi:TNT domain-containing protein [Actinomadura miaoliensis]|uniref:TNT domain-containing protein n=1 Tax=Actinomadura miaoliensis TaxID=430685 RepID=A0ABP7VRU9_9ACTN